MSAQAMAGASVWSRPGQIIVISIVSVCLSLIVLSMARRSQLSMRYTLGWIFVAICVAIGGLFGGLVEPFANALDVDSAVLVAGVTATGLLAIAVQLSISVSGLIEISRTLAESLALLQERLEALEAERTHNGKEGEC
ncbi:DUF2304 domain-containing protein [Gemmatimonas sp.]|uniref:DUF2304 domain-containing protein n=1 Tax=Gemmatimonas sp. TaxID=1962908 RepID=UPI003564DA4B